MTSNSKTILKNKFYTWVFDSWKDNKPEPYDILPYLSDEWGRLRPAQKKEALKDLMSWVKNELMSQYWSRCEYEMLVLPWPSGDKDNPVKVDIYQQALPNLSLITKLFAENEGIA